ncbi:MAG: hypothetical protein ACU85V_20415 [Gammaproteobacteria bacterium]
MTAQFLLVVVFVAAGAVEVDVEAHENGAACYDAAVSRGIELRAHRMHPVLVECVPVSKAWGLLP